MATLAAIPFIKDLLEEVDKKNSWGKTQIKDLILELMTRHMENE